MQQQQDRHQNILSQTKRLLSHHHHNHHLSNAQHLQILSNSMKTLWQSFFTYEIPYTRQEEQEKEEEAEEYDESRTSV
jgi:hypothetical protein